MFSEWGIPPIFENATFNNFIVYPWHEELIKAARDYVDAWPDQLNHGSGLIISGSPGTGKSHVAAAISREIILKGYSVFFCYTAKFLRETYAAYREITSEVLESVFDRACSPDLLIFDDICSVDITAFDRVTWGYKSDWIIGLLTRIYEYRISKKLPTMILTVDTKEEFYSFLPGIRSRSRCIEIGKQMDMRTVIKEEIFKDFLK